MVAASVAVLALTPIVAGAGPEPVDPGRIAVQVFTSDETQIITMRPDGRRLDLVFSSEDHRGFDCVAGLDLSIDGTKIVAAFCPLRRAHLYTMAADGSNFRRLGSTRSVSSPEWSPDGASIAMSAGTRSGHSSIYVLSADGQTVDRVTGAFDPSASSPTWSPDGSRLAYVETPASQPDRIVIMDLAEMRSRVVYRTRMSKRLSSPAWSPDGTSIAFTRYNRLRTRADVWTIGVDGTGATNVTTTQNMTETFPEWRPDGTAIAYLVADQTSGSRDIGISTPDGEIVRRIVTRADEVTISWGGGS